MKKKMKYNEILGLIVLNEYETSKYFICRDIWNGRERLILRDATSKGLILPKNITKILEVNLTCKKESSYESKEVKPTYNEDNLEYYYDGGDIRLFIDYIVRTYGTFLVETQGSRNIIAKNRYEAYKYIKEILNDNRAKPIYYELQNRLEFKLGEDLRKVLKQEINLYTVYKTSFKQYITEDNRKEFLLGVEKYDYWFEYTLISIDSINDIILN